MHRRICVLLCVICLFSLSSCGESSSIGSVPMNSSEFELDFGAEKSKSSATSQESSVDEYLDTSPYLQINPTNIFSMDEDVSYEDRFMLSNLKLIKSKELPNWITKDQFHYFSGEITDKNGTLTSSHTYVFLTVDIKNLKDTKEEINLASIGYFVALDENYCAIGLGVADANYRSEGDSIEAKDYFEQKFDAHIVKTFTIGYIFDDDLLSEESLYYIVGSSSVAVGGPTENVVDENLKAYKIEFK